MFTFDFSTAQRSAVSAVCALVLATLFVTAAVGPVEAAVLMAPVL